MLQLDLVADFQHELFPVHALLLWESLLVSFPRGTCVLSVSHQYLALGEISLLIKAAISNNPTL